MAVVLSTREQISVALFNAVSVAAGSVANLVTSSRRPRAFTDVMPSEMPALFMEELPEDVQYTFGKMVGIQVKRTMMYHIALYTSDPQDPSVVPMSQMNAMIDAIELALAPDAVTNTQTLGGLVYSARIEGELLKFENVQNDGKSVAIIPISVVRP